MSRPLRIEFPGAVYHGMNRGLNQKNIFLSKKDYDLFLTTLQEACSLFQVTVYAYCLMPNHYHLLVCTPSANLSRFMRHLNGVYTQRFNREHNRDGPLFRGRFKSVLVQEDSYLIEVVRYIHKNPLKAKMVDRLSQFQWSSHPYYTSNKSPISGLDTSFLLRYFSRNRKRAVEEYKRFMAQPVDEELEKFYSAKKQGSILGDLDFIDLIKEKYLYIDPEIEVVEKRVPGGEGILRKIKKEVCRVFNVSDKHLFEGKRGTTNIARQVALALTKELSGLKLSEIGPYFGIGSYRTVGTHCWRLQGKLRTDKSLRAKYNNLKVTCSQEKT
jgi:putative transposase